MKKIFFWLILILIVAGFFELGGYCGLRFLNTRFQASDMLEIPEEIRPDWWGNVYFRLRDILRGKPDVYTKYYPTYNLNYDLTPNFKSFGKVQHNEDGYRGPKINCAKGDKYRVLFLGESTTYGVVKDAGETFPAQAGLILNDYLQKHPMRWKGAEVINAGIEGALLTDQLHRYLYKFKYYKPDLVVIHSGGNDLWMDVTEDNFNPDYTTKRSFELWKVEKILPEWMMNSYFVSFVAVALYYHPKGIDIERATTLQSNKFAPQWFPKELKEKIKQGDLTYHPYYTNYNTLVRTILNDSAQVLALPFALNPKFAGYKPKSRYLETNRQNNEIMHQVIEKYNGNWLNYQYDSIKPEYWVDHCHVNAAGEKQKAGVICNKIIEIMTRQNAQNQ